MTVWAVPVAGVNPLVRKSDSIRRSVTTSRQQQKQEVMREKGNQPKKRLDERRLQTITNLAPGMERSMLLPIV